MVARPWHYYTHDVMYPTFVYSNQTQTAPPKLSPIYIHPVSPVAVEGQQEHIGHYSIELQRPAVYAGFAQCILLHILYRGRIVFVYVTENTV